MARNRNRFEETLAKIAEAGVVGSIEVSFDPKGKAVTYYEVKDGWYEEITAEKYAELNTTPDPRG